MIDILNKISSLLYDIYLDSLRDRVFPIGYFSGKFLSLLCYIVCSRSRFVRFLEVGSGYGFSTIWFILPVLLSRSHGYVISLDVNFSRTCKALVNMRNLGFSSHVDFVVSDGKMLPFRYGLYFDIILIDAEKEEYLEYFKECERYSKVGTLILAHNVFQPHLYKISNFLREILESDRWFTVLVPIDPAGMSVSLKVKG